LLISVCRIFSGQNTGACRIPQDSSGFLRIPFSFGGFLRRNVILRTHKIVPVFNAKTGTFLFVRIPVSLHRNSTACSGFTPKKLVDISV
jgi:hypothetical protein